MRIELVGGVGVVLAVLLGVTPAAAQQDRSVSVSPVDYLDVGAAPERVDLLLGKARIIRLSTDARDVLVANPDVADVVIRTPRLIYILGRQVGDTNVFFFDAEGNEILRLDARVERDLDALRKAIAVHLPDADVKVSSVNNNIVITGKVVSPEASEDVNRIARRFVENDSQIINMVTIAGDQQVVLRVRIAEIQRSAIKALGLQYQLQYNFGAGDVLSLGLNTLPLASSIGGNNPGSIFQGGGGNTSLIGVRTAGSSAAFGILIDALESNSLAKTLAEPNLTALSGETANFLAGGEFPIPVSQNEDAITVSFREFGIALDFTPLVLSDRRISLRISTEVSATSTATPVGSFSVPSLVVRRAQTTVDLPSGGSLVIAGLLQDDIRETIKGVPGLKDLPVLGALFRSVEFQRDETELVVAVTAYLVNPVDDQQVALPTDGFAPASDIDMYLFGRLQATYAKSEAMPSLEELKAPTGYILE